MIAAASVLVLYGGLTLGAQAVSAIGVGVAKPPKNVADTAYVGVRLDHAAAHRRRAARRRSATWACRWSSTRRPPRHRSVELETLADQRRRHRQRRLGEGLVPALEPRPQRRLQGRQGDRAGGRASRPTSSVPVAASTRSTSTTRTARSRSWSSPTTPSARRACPTRLAAGQGLRARRSRPRPDGHGGRGGRPRRAVRVGRPARRAARGAALNRRAPAEVRRRRRGTRGCGARSRSCTPRPRSAGVSPIGVRFTPALVGVGRRGSRRAHVRRRSRPRVDAAVPRRARRARVARDVLHAR